MTAADINPAPVGEHLLRMRDVTTKVGLGKSKVYAMIGEGQFPRPVIAGGAAVRWRSSDIEAWIAALPVA